MWDILLLLSVTTQIEKFKDELFKVYFVGSKDCHEEILSRKIKNQSSCLISRTLPSVQTSSHRQMPRFMTRPLNRVNFNKDISYSVWPHINLSVCYTCTSDCSRCVCCGLDWFCLRGQCCQTEKKKHQMKCLNKVLHQRLTKRFIRSELCRNHSSAPYVNFCEREAGVKISL